MKKLLLLLPYYFTFITTNAQITFEKTFNGLGTDYGYSVLQTSDSGFIIAGVTGLSYLNTDVFLIKTDKFGDTLWTKTIGGVNDDRARSIVSTFDGGYCIAGYTKSYGAGNYDVYLIKINSYGDTLWTKTIGGTGNDEGFSLITTLDGGFCVAGFTNYLGASYYDVYLIRTDSLGDTLWTKTFGNTRDDMGFSVAQTNDSGFIITGFTENLNTFYANAYLIKTNAVGDTLWTKNFGGSSYDDGRSVKQTSDSGYIITGLTQRPFSIEDIFLVRTNSNGDTLWTKYFGTSGWDHGESVALTSDGGFIITGELDQRLCFVKTDSNGDTLWSKVFMTSQTSTGYSVSQTYDNGFIIAGYSPFWQTGIPDVCLIKTDSNGVSFGTLGNNDYLLSAKNGITISPNPTTGIAKIQMSPQFKQIKTLEIYDYTGQLIQRTFDNFSKLNISNLTSGLYFLVLTNFDNKRLSCKIIKE